MATLVLSVIGDDRPGLVDALAAPIADHGGNWDRSHMARLAGKFAGVVVATVPDAEVDGLRTSLHRLGEQHVLELSIAIAGPDQDDTDSAADATGLAHLHLIGQDRPGIVREVAGALARSGVSIDELETSARSAPMSAEQLFEARATLRLPGDSDLDALRSTLEAIANELMVDLDVSSDRHPV